MTRDSFWRGQEDKIVESLGAGGGKTGRGVLQGCMIWGGGGKEHLEENLVGRNNCVGLYGGTGTNGSSANRPSC